MVASCEASQSRHTGYLIPFFFSPRASDASQVFALAAILEGCPYLNGSPQNTFVPGVVEVAKSEGVYIGGSTQEWPGLSFACMSCCEDGGGVVMISFCCCGSVFDLVA